MRKNMLYERRILWNALISCAYTFTKSALIAESKKY